MILTRTNNWYRSAARTRQPQNAYGPTPASADRTDKYVQATVPQKSAEMRTSSPLHLGGGLGTVLNQGP